MKVAILYSGGKDSTYALEYAKERGWDVSYLISVKPTRKDCFLFHYATVEHTPMIARMLNIPHMLLSCDVANPVQEADIIKQAVMKQQKSNPVDAVILGGTGLQETQIKSIQHALLPLKIEVFAAHAGLDHADVMELMTSKGYEFMITQVASDGLLPWLGKKITKSNLHLLIDDALRYGFHSGGEGGYYDSLVIDCPLFPKKIEIDGMQKVIDDKYCGHILINKIQLVEKEIEAQPNL